MTHAPDPAPAAGDFNRDEVERIRDPFARLRVIMKCLLDPGGCPWDREQTHASLRQYFIEEVYEACEAIDDGDDEALCEELGDVALQIVFHAELADRGGRFTVDDVMERICRKLVDRHPHVFGEVRARDSGEVLRNWEQIKRAEKSAAAARTGDRMKKSIISGVPRALPGLQRAGRLQEKASRVGFDWDRPEDVADKVREEVEEFLEAVASHDGEGAEAQPALHEEFGDLLFSLVNLSRFMNIQAEEAMERACNKFIARFTAIEHMAEERGLHLKDLTLAEMDALWDEVKRQGARETDRGNAGEAP